MLEDLREAIEKLHGVRAVWSETAPVREEFQGAVVWDGDVQVFVITGHASAKRCFAWSHTQDGTDRRRIVTVLETKEIDSPAMAVRAAIIQQWRNQSKK